MLENRSSVSKYKLIYFISSPLPIHPNILAICQRFGLHSLPQKGVVKLTDKQPSTERVHNNRVVLYVNHQANQILFYLLFY